MEEERRLGKLPRASHIRQAIVSIWGSSVWELQRVVGLFWQEERHGATCIHKNI